MSSERHRNFVMPSPKFGGRTVSLLLVSLKCVNSPSDTPKSSGSEVRALSSKLHSRRFTNELMECGSCVRPVWRICKFKLNTCQYAATIVHIRQILMACTCNTVSLDIVEKASSGKDSRGDPTTRRFSRWLISHTSAGSWATFRQ